MVWTVEQLAVKVSAEFEGDGSTKIDSVAPIQSAQSGQISFVANKKYSKHIATTKASALVLDPESDAAGKPVIRHTDPYLIFAHIIDILNPEIKLVEPGIHPQSVIDDGVTVGDNLALGPFCHIRSGTVLGNNCQCGTGVYIGRNVKIGDNCLLYPGVSIMDDSVIGNNVIIHSSTVIGSDGFGFAPTTTGMKKVRQIGRVEIGDDVEIGSNCSVDRGALETTRIGRGTKIDNLVQVAHNVQIGQHCIIVSQVGISGSSILGNGVVLAGQVGISGHIELGDGVQVGAQSGVPKSVPAGKKVFGYPARDIMLTMRIEASLPKLPDLFKRVRKIEKQLPDESGD